MNNWWLSVVWSKTIEVCTGPFQSQFLHSWGLICFTVKYLGYFYTKNQFTLIPVSIYSDFHMWCKNMHMSSMLNRLNIKENGKLTLKMLQIGNEAGKLSPVTRLWSWKKSSISTVTSHEGDGSKLLIGFVSPNVNLKSGSKTVEWNGRKKIWKSPNLKAVKA